MVAIGLLGYQNCGSGECGLPFAAFPEGPFTLPSWYQAPKTVIFRTLLHNGRVLGGSWDLVSKVISPLIGVISNYKYSYLIYNPSY